MEPPPPLPPLSSTNSPSHEFSFTISLHPSSISTPNSMNMCNDKTTSPSLALDLAPADDIFFHGHLLPLQFLSHPITSPRPSDFSIEDFSLPLEHFSAELNPNHSYTRSGDGKEGSRRKPFSSLFGLGRWWKGSIDATEKEEGRKKRTKKGFDVSRFWKKYARMVEPLFFGKGEKERRNLRRRPYSFSGNSNPRMRDGWVRRRGELSAPASMRTSPTNSGLLFATSASTFSSSDDSTMEELQSAIQAAIAHCKNSTAMKEEKCKC